MPAPAHQLPTLGVWVKGKSRSWWASFLKPLLLQLECLSLWDKSLFFRTFLPSKLCWRSDDILWTLLETPRKSSVHEGMNLRIDAAGQGCDCTHSAQLLNVNKLERMHKGLSVSQRCRNTKSQTWCAGHYVFTSIYFKWNNKSRYSILSNCINSSF